MKVCVPFIDTWDESQNCPLVAPETLYVISSLSFFCLSFKYIQSSISVFFPLFVLEAMFFLYRYLLFISWTAVESKVPSFPNSKYSWPWGTALNLVPSVVPKAFMAKELQLIDIENISYRASCSGPKYTSISCKSSCLTRMPWSLWFLVKWW